LYLLPKLVCIHQNFLHRVYTNLNSSFLDPSFLEWRLGCKTCIVSREQYLSSRSMHQDQNMFTINIYICICEKVLFACCIMSWIFAFFGPFR
jgi:hypothetical protein